MWCISSSTTCICGATTRMCRPISSRYLTSLISSKATARSSLTGQTPLISHTSVDIVTSLTGVYPDKWGIGVGNSFGEFVGTGVSFASTFEYWTDISPDGLPFMLAPDGHSIFSAPWVPFTRAGCDVGAFSIANIEFENVSTDINNVFGPSSTEAAEAKSHFSKAVADFEGIIIHSLRLERRFTVYERRRRA